MRGRNNITILKNRLTLGKGAGFFTALGWIVKRERAKQPPGETN